MSRRRSDVHESSRLPAGWDALDILVNNVGTNIRKPSLTISDAEFRTVVRDEPHVRVDLSRAAAAAPGGVWASPSTSARSRGWLGGQRRYAMSSRARI
jgi:hypothetical protein